jgi:hypothetical protein
MPPRLAAAPAIGNFNAMWGRKSKSTETATTEEAAPGGLKDAMRQARIETAERSNIVVDLRDAAVARLELLSEALDPVFKDIPDEIEMFDRGISRGDMPRLWIDVLAHVMLGRDKRTYRFVQDTRYGRKVIAESGETADIADAVTKYVARRLIERERALADDTITDFDLRKDKRRFRRRRGGRSFTAFVFGMLVGAAGLIAAIWFLSARL